jgi:predicted nucleotidyltransferase
MPLSKCSAIDQLGDDSLLSSLTEIARKSGEILDDITHAPRNQVDAAVVFGSVARGGRIRKSDVDVLVLGDGLSSLRIILGRNPLTESITVKFTLPLRHAENSNKS